MEDGKIVVTVSGPTASGKTRVILLMKHAILFAGLLKNVTFVEVNEKGKQDGN
jgi:hypothetical protein